MTLCDTKGIVFRGRTAGMNQWKSAHAVDTPLRTLEEAMFGAAMANPDPEITPEDAQKTRDDVIIATGRERPSTMRPMRTKARAVLIDALRDAQRWLGIVRVNSILPVRHQGALQLHCFCSRIAAALGRIDAENRLYLFALTMPLRR